MPEESGACPSSKSVKIMLGNTLFTCYFNCISLIVKIVYFLMALILLLKKKKDAMIS